MKKFVVIFFILALGFLAYFGYLVIKKRYFTKPIIETPAIENIQPETDQLETISDDGEVLNENDQTEEDIQGEDVPEKNPVKFLEITPKDCADKCVKYTADQEDLKYCQESCGLATSTANQDGCSQLEGLDADYCYKDLAVSKKDFKICDKIRDAGIKKTCQNRITEDLINGSGGLAD